MLPGERVLPETILTLSNGVVNRLFDYLKSESDRRLSEQFYQCLKELQVRWFSLLRDQVLCPSCRSSELIRKGWRRRILKSSRGRLQIVVLQARCKRCGRSFRPLNAPMGLTFSKRFLDELLIKGLWLSTQLSYDRSAAIMKHLVGGEISSEGLRQKIAQKATTLSFHQPLEKETVLVDATKVKSGKKQRGSPVYMAITAKKGPTVAGRPTVIKRLVHLHVGSAALVKKSLKALKVKRLVHDGGEDFTHQATKTQRCHWHLVHQLKHYLWQDGVSLIKRSPYQGRLRGILADKEHGGRRLARFIKDLEDEGLQTSAGHLQNAQPEAFTFVKEPEFTFSTTSPLEREMRELNRRADNGARWSDKGVQSLLKVLFHYRLNKPAELIGLLGAR